MKDFETKGLGIIEYLLNRNLYTPTDIILISCLYHLIKSRKKNSINATAEEYKLISNLTGLSISTIKKKFYEYIKRQGKWLEKDKDNYKVGYNVKNALENSRVAFFIPTNILNNKDLTISDRLVLAYILSYNKRFKTCNLHSETIANKLKIETDSVRKIIVKLKKLDLLSIEEEKQGFITKRREFKTNTDAIQNYYIESIERAKIKEAEIQAIKEAKIREAEIANIENTANIENIENTANIANIENAASIEKVESIENANIENIENANINTNILNLIIDDFSNIDLSKASNSDLNKLYFNLKNKLELIKTYKNSRS